MVHGQVYPAQIGLGILREESYRGNVRGNYILRRKIGRGGVGEKVGRGVLCQLWVWQQIRGLAQSPQSRAQSSGAAHGISIRTDMSENQHMIHASQQIRSFGNSECHSSSSVLMGVSRSTWRSSSRI